jgi:hypothetical protein
LCSQWCADLSDSVIEVATTNATTKSTAPERDKPHRSVSAYDAVAAAEKGENAMDADVALQAKLRRRLIAYVESSLELPRSPKL